MSVAHGFFLGHGIDAVVDALIELQFDSFGTGLRGGAPSIKRDVEVFFR